MDKLNFYKADFDYVKHLQEAEKESRGFSRVPNMEYTNRKYIARDFFFRAMIQPEAEEIANNWKYDDVYSFYDISADAEDYADFIDEEKRGNNYFSYYLKDELIAWYSLDVLENGNLELGLGIKPSHTGKGFGFHFVNAVMVHAASIHCVHGFELSVASFNHRAIRVYEKVGFRIIETFMQNTNGGNYKFMKMMKDIR